MAHTTEKIKILQFNVYCRNNNLDDVVTYIKNNHDSFDLIFLQEVVPELETKLLILNKIYPHTVAKRENKNYGRVLLSKIPVTDYSFHYFDRSHNHFMLANLKTQTGNSFTVFGIHTTSPKNKLRWQKRNKEMAIISKVVKDCPGENKIIIGDFNTTPYSYHFKKLASTSGLKQPKTNFLPNTWPSFFPFSGMRIPIDHILTSNNIIVSHRQTITDLGSDHLPVVTYVDISS